MSLGSVGPDALHLLRAAGAATSISFDAGQRPDAEVHGLLVVVLGDEVGFFGAQLHLAPRRSGARCAPFRSATIRFLNSSVDAQVGVGEQVDLDQVALGLTDGREVVVALQRRVHVARAPD